jgi:hypothetical protein
MAACHDTPKPRAARATDCSPGPTRRQISARARSVSTARGAISSHSSDHVPAGHAGSAQRHSRLAHTSTTGRSAIGRSRTTTRRRPWPTARTPQDGHQARSWVVSTASHHSPVVSSSNCARTTNPSSPSSADTPLPSRSIRGLLLM